MSRFINKGTAKWSIPLQHETLWGEMHYFDIHDFSIQPIGFKINSVCLIIILKKCKKFDKHWC